MNLLSLTCFAILLVVATTTANAEPPRADAAPYLPSGWRPSGRQFSLPLRKAPRDAYKAPPKEQYGPPAPAASYGPPPASTTEAPTTTPEPATTVRAEEVDETTEETTDEPDYKDEENSGAGARAISVATVQQQQQQHVLDEEEAPTSGVYYVLLGDGRLQRVAYTTQREDQRAFQRLVAAPQPINAGYLAVQYQDVQPIQAPVYTYGQQDTLYRIFKK